MAGLVAVVAMDHLLTMLVVLQHQGKAITEVVGDSKRVAVAVVLVLLVLMLAVIVEVLEAMVLHRLSRGLLLPVQAVAVVAQKEVLALVAMQALGALAVVAAQALVAQMRLQIQDRAVAVALVAVLELAAMAVLAL
jgi:hypothetical protein